MKLELSSSSQFIFSTINAKGDTNGAIEVFFKYTPQSSVE